MSYTAPVRDLLFALNAVAGFAQLRALAKFGPRKVQVIELRFFRRTQHRRSG